MLKGQKGITLVALVITIIVLIILAGVSISLVLSDQSVFNKAVQARENYAAGAKEENGQLTNAWDYAEKTITNLEAND